MKEVDKCFVLCVFVCLSFGLSAYLKTAQTVDTRTQSCKTLFLLTPESSLEEKTPERDNTKDDDASAAPDKQ